MAFSTADIAALKAALATGAQRVRFADGREVWYRSLGEIRQIISQAEAEAGGAPPRQHSVAAF
jgi:hypothetical protein